MQVPAPARLSGEQHGQRKVDQRWRAERARFSPVESRMREENRDAAHKEPAETRGRDPVRGSHERRVAAVGPLDHVGILWRTARLVEEEVHVRNSGEAGAGSGRIAGTWASTAVTCCRTC